MEEEKKFQETTEQAAMKASESAECPQEELIVKEEPKSFSDKYKKKIIVAAVLLVALIVIGGGLKVTSAGFIAQKYAKAYFLCDEKTMDRLSVIDQEESGIYWFAKVKCLGTYLDESSAYQKNHSLEEYEKENMGKYGAFEFYAAKSDAYDEDITNWNELCKVRKRERTYDLEEEFGSYKIQAEKRSEKFVRSSSFDETDIEGYQLFGIDWENIGKIKGETIRIKVEGDYNRASYNILVYLIRDGVCWKVLDYQELD